MVQEEHELFPITGKQILNFYSSATTMKMGVGFSIHSLNKVFTTFYYFNLTVEIGDCESLAFHQEVAWFQSLQITQTVKFSPNCPPETQWPSQTYLEGNCNR